jgi:hypothetical protein
MQRMSEFLIPHPSQTDKRVLWSHYGSYNLGAERAFQVYQSSHQALACDTLASNVVASLCLSVAFCRYPGKLGGGAISPADSAPGPASCFGATGVPGPC